MPGLLGGLTLREEKTRLVLHSMPSRGVRARFVERGLRLLISGAIPFASPTVALAEVMDKEPSVGRIWAWACCAGLAGLVGWPLAWPLGSLAALLGAAFVVLFSEIADPYVGRAIASEAGYSYVYQSYAACAVFVLLHGVGLALRLNRRRRATVVQDG